MSVYSEHAWNCSVPCEALPVIYRYLDFLKDARFILYIILPTYRTVDSMRMYLPARACGPPRKIQVHAMRVTLPAKIKLQLAYPANHSTLLQF